MLSLIFQTVCDSKEKRRILALIRKYNIAFRKVCVKFLILNIEAFNFRYNISFIDPPLGGFSEILPSVMIFPSGQSPSGNIITSGNISPNPPSGGSINDKYYIIILYYIILYYIILYYIILYYIILYYIILYYIILYYIILYYIILYYIILYYITLYYIILYYIIPQIQIVQ